MNFSLDAFNLLSEHNCPCGIDRLEALELFVNGLKEIDRLKAENEKYRKALEMISTNDEKTMLAWITYGQWCSRIAKETLKAEESK